MKNQLMVLVTMYFAGKVAAKIAPRQKEWVKAIQRRVGMTASMLASMKSVKMMGLERVLFDTIQSQRVRELDLSKRFRVMMMWRMLLCMCSFDENRLR
jgi:ATP-binding cassette subfamily C (CFTR/MRP) protein 1